MFSRIVLLLACLYLLSACALLKPRQAEESGALASPIPENSSDAAAKQPDPGVIQTDLPQDDKAEITPTTSETDRIFETQKQVDVDPNHTSPSEQPITETEPSLATRYQIDPSTTEILVDTAAPGAPDNQALAEASTSIKTGEALTATSFATDIPQTTVDLDQHINEEENFSSDKVDHFLVYSQLSGPDIWQQIRDGFQLDPNLSNPRVEIQLKWYADNPDYVSRTFNRSRKYLAYIVSQVQDREFPLELALLPVVESAYDPFAYSHGRASGLWQFIPGTGRRYGLKQNWWYDGRRDIVASTRAALDYLGYLNELFDGDWLHALAAYNSGSGRVSSAIRRNKKKHKPYSFWKLKLPRETRAYVPKLLAIAEIVRHPEKYNIDLPDLNDDIYFDVVHIGSQIDLAQAAELADTDIEEIYSLNPGFNRWATAPLGPHRLLLPADSSARFIDQLSNQDKNSRLTWNRYKIRNGDSLIKIARKFHTTPAVIKQVNGLRSNSIRAGQKLLIPIASKKDAYYNLSANNRLLRKQENYSGSKGSKRIDYIVKSGDTIWDLARKHKVGMRSLAKWNGMAPTDVLRPGQKLVIWSRSQKVSAPQIKQPQLKQRKMIRKIGYRVRKGDSLARIASKFSVSVHDIVVWNKLNPKKYLQPGQKLALYIDLRESS